MSHLDLVTFNTEGEKKKSLYNVLAEQRSAWGVNFDLIQPWKDRLVEAAKTQQAQLSNKHTVYLKYKMSLGMSTRKSRPSPCNVWVQT